MRKMNCTATPVNETCCFTGHRSIPSDDIFGLSKRLYAAVEELYARGIRNFRCGGALGFDTMAARAVIALRREKGDVRLVLILPCTNQASRWDSRDIREYEKIRGLADEVVYTSVEYTSECMFIRNRALVDGSSVCVSYLNSASGGTAYTVRYAKKRGVDVINLGSYPVKGADRDTIRPF